LLDHELVVLLVLVVVGATSSKSLKPGTARMRMLFEHVIYKVWTLECI